MLLLVRRLLVASLLLAAAPLRAAVNVVATTEDLAALTREVGGDRVKVEAIARGYQDPHFVEAKPSFILKLHSADLLVLVGREMEIGWLPPLVQQSRNAKIQPGAEGYLDASLTARILEIPTGQITRAMGDVHPLGNPHYWLDPGNGRRIAKAVAEKLARMSPADAAYFDGRYADFDKRLAEAEKRWDALLAPYKGLQVVTYHASWPNFCERFGLKVMGYVEPRPGIPPSPSHTIDLIREMKRLGVKILMVEPYFDLKTPQSVARETGAQVLVLSPSVGGVKEAADYIKLFDYDLDLLVAAIKATGAMTVIDWSVLQFLAAPFAASLILTGIHAYLGVHVIERGVIFVDLSLAQIAALGSTMAILLPFTGQDPHGPWVYWTGLLFTFIGAAIFSMVKVRHARIPQEAIIGIAYAVASAATILAMSQSTSESEHLKDMLVGNILAVSWPEVGKTAALYAGVGLFHYLFRKPFLAISLNHDKAEAEGLNVRLWDFLFYASFGFVVTSSVLIAGVLLVFCYLIVPSVAAILYAESIGRRLAIGWTMGTVVSALGIYLSVKLDLPTGAAMVCTFGLVLILMALVRPLIRRRPAVAPTG